MIIIIVMQIMASATVCVSVASDTGLRLTFPNLTITIISSQQ
jgi:hypothetical protein